jgi:hypothetical protein
VVIASEAKQSISPHKERMDCFVAEFIIGPAEGRTRWLLAMTVIGRGHHGFNVSFCTRQFNSSATYSTFSDGHAIA